MGMAIKRVGIVGSGIMGVGHRRGGRRPAASRWSCAAASQATADAMVAGMAKSLASRSRRASGPRPSATRPWRRVTAISDLARAGRLRPGHRVGGRGPGRQEAPLLRARPHLRRPHHPGHQHLHPAGGGAWPWRPGRPDKVCGIHFFNPAPVMSLVEVVRPITAADETIAAALAFAEACGKSPVEVKDQAGLHRQRPAVPLPEQRRAPARAGRGRPGRASTRP